MGVTNEQTLAALRAERDAAVARATKAEASLAAQPLHIEAFDALRGDLAAAIARAETAERELGELRAKLDAGLKAATPVYCKHCPFSRHVHYMRDGKLVTPSCSGFEPMDEPDQEEGH